MCDTDTSRKKGNHSYGIIYFKDGNQLYVHSPLDKIGLATLEWNTVVQIKSGIYSAEMEVLLDAFISWLENTRQVKDSSSRVFDSKTERDEIIADMRERFLKEFGAITIKEKIFDFLLNCPNKYFGHTEQRILQFLTEYDFEQIDNVKIFTERPCCLACQLVIVGNPYKEKITVVEGGGDYDDFNFFNEFLSYIAKSLYPIDEIKGLIAWGLRLIKGEIAKEYKKEKIIIKSHISKDDFEYLVPKPTLISSSLPIFLSEKDVSTDILPKDAEQKISKTICSKPRSREYLVHREGRFN